MKYRNTARVQLILMRHGLAVERDEWQGDDFSRPLTPKGHEKTAKAAHGLRALCKTPALIAASPKVRARQTAEIARDAWGKQPPLEIWPELAQDNFADWLKKLGSADKSSLLIVGHEPDLSRFASLLLMGDADKIAIKWKKAGALGLDLDLLTARATLLWMMSPQSLRKLAA